MRVRSGPRSVLMRVLLAAACTLVGVIGVAASSSASRGRLALILGDSLTSEIKPVLVAPSGWRLEYLAYPGIAPCDWLRGPALGRLLARGPSLVLIETAANDFTPCMKVNGALPALGSTSFLRRYEQSLLAVIRESRNHGAKVVYIDAPPFFDPVLQRASVSLDTWARARMTVSASPRWAVSVNGQPALYMRCLESETAADGCTFGQIPVRTVDETDHQHFCPFHRDFTRAYTCRVYSSGEHRWAKAVMRLIRTAA